MSVRSAGLDRVTAVVRADFLMRIRRPSSLVVLLALSALAYLIVPDLSTGRSLMIVNGRRGLYNSATIALATAGLASILLGLLGFYLVSNAIGRDIVARTGYIIAAMPVRDAEYLVGKFLANTLSLGLVVLGYLLSVMVMHLLRAERPLEPAVYLTTYLAIVGPGALVVSAVALLFEAAGPLSGRVGDVLYFFVWLALLTVAAVGMSRGGGGTQGWSSPVDVFGLSFMVTQVKGGQPITSLQIGQSDYDPTRTPWVFDGIRWTWAVVGSRVATALLAVPVLALAWISFPRFNPARIKGGIRHAARHPIAVLNRWLKPATRLLAPLTSRRAGGAGSLARIILSEVLLTFMLSPLALLAALGLAVWGALADSATLRQAVLPVSFLVITIAVADLVSRDRPAGTTALLYSLPRMKPAFVAVKFLGAVGTALAFVIVPLGRLAIVQPASALSLLIGAGFVGALAVGLGFLTGGSKAFIGIFLLFLYVVMSSAGAPPVDFAGFNGVATNGVRLGYLVLTGGMVSLAVAKHRLELARG